MKKRLKEVIARIELYIAATILVLALLLGVFHIIDIIITIFEKMSTTWQIITLIVSTIYITKKMIKF